jgi:hypothetical protein
LASVDEIICVEVDEEPTSLAAVVRRSLKKHGPV